MICTVLICLSLISIGIRALVVHSPQSLARNYHSPYAMADSNTDSVNGIIESSSNGCDNLVLDSTTNGKYLGKIVLVSLWNGCSPETQITYFEALNASGILFAENSITPDLQASIAKSWYSPTQFSIPAAFINENVASLLRSSTDPVNVTINYDDASVNYYNNLLASDWGFALTFLLPTLISGINWLVTLWKLSCFYKDYGVCAASIAQTCLTFAFIGNSQRIIQFIWEHDITCCSYQFRQVMYSSSFSLTLSSCVLLAFYWMDSIHHKQGLKRFKVASAISVILLITSEIGLSIWRGEWFSAGLVASWMTVLGYMVISFVVATLFLVSGIRVLRQVSSSNVIHRRQQAAMRISRLLVIASVLLLCWIICIALLGLLDLQIINTSKLSDNEVYVLTSVYVGVACSSQVCFMLIDSAIITLFPTSYRLLHRCSNFVSGKLLNSPSSDEEEIPRFGSINSGSLSKPSSWICCRVCAPRSDEYDDLLGVARSGRSARENSI